MRSHPGFFGGFPPIAIKLDQSDQRLGMVRLNLSHFLPRNKSLIRLPVEFVILRQLDQKRQIVRNQFERLFQFFNGQIRTTFRLIGLGGEQKQRRILRFFLLKFLKNFPCFQALTRFYKIGHQRLPSGKNHNGSRKNDDNESQYFQNMNLHLRLISSAPLFIPRTSSTPCPFASISLPPRIPEPETL